MDNLSKLPEMCFTVHMERMELIRLRRGVEGYQRLRQPLPLPIVGVMRDMLNAQLGVTVAQEKAMTAGSMFGFDTPVADPDGYDPETGTPKPETFALLVGYARELAHNAGGLPDSISLN